MFFNTTGEYNAGICKQIIHKVRFNELPNRKKHGINSINPPSIGGRIFLSYPFNKESSKNVMFLTLSNCFSASVDDDNPGTAVLFGLGAGGGFCRWIRDLQITMGGEERNRWRNDRTIIFQSMCDRFINAKQLWLLIGYVRLQFTGNFAEEILVSIDYLSSRIRSLSQKKTRFRSFEVQSV